MVLYPIIRETSFLDYINSQIEYRLKDRNHIGIFNIFIYNVERNYKLEITVKILLQK